MRSKTLKVGVERKISHESTVRDALWDMSTISTAQLKADKIRTESKVYFIIAIIISETNELIRHFFVCFSSPQVKYILKKKSLPEQEVYWS